MTTAPARRTVHRVGRRAAAAAAVLGLAAGLLPVLTVPAAAEAAPRLSAPSVVEQPDHFSEVHANPLDFDDADDLLLDQAPTNGLTGSRLEAGELRTTVTAPGYFSPVWGGYPGALYLGREGGAPENRVDTARYTHISFAAYADRPAAAGLMWFSCEGLDPQCQGGRPFQLEEGWNVYHLELRNLGYGLPSGWDGSVSGLRLAVTPTAGPTALRVDWMRLTRGGGASLDWSTPRGGSEATLFWDADGDDANNTPGAPGWGAVPCDERTRCTTTSSRSTDLSFLPPGRYRFWAQAGDTRGAVSQVLEVRRRPRPVVVDPDAVGGPDYATEVLGNPWDFSDAADVASTGGARDVGVAGGRLWGTNTDNDPFVWFRVGPAIDPARYHRLTVTSGYEGAFDLRDIAGGGAHGRVVWRDADQPSVVRQTREWVTYSGTSTLTTDLARPASEVHESDVAGRSWLDAAKTGLRWDPNEDRGARRWWVDDVALRADDETGGEFVVRWLDTAHEPGSTVDVFADTDRAGFDGRRIASGVPGGPGTTSLRWDTSDLPEGTYWVHVAVRSAAGDTGRAYAGGPVRVDRSLSGQGASPTVVDVRSIDDACPSFRVPDSGLRDVPGGSVGTAISCLAWYGVTSGKGGSFDPTGTVTRGQMATFVARAVVALGGNLPADAPDAFADDDGSTHEASIDSVVAAGVVAGFPDGTYRPDEPVTRAQMATFLARAWQHAGGQELPWGPDSFGDDGGNAHEAAIDRVAAAGVAGGRQPGAYAPGDPVRRDQMASFLTRLLDYGIQAGATTAR